MMETSLLTSILLPWCAGYTLVLFILGKNSLPWPVTMALGYGIGMGLLTQWMLGLGTLGLTWTLENIALPIIFLTILLLLSPAIRNRFSGVRRGQEQESKAWHPLTLVLIVYIVYVTFYVFWRSLNIPIYYWDEVATIAFQAKGFFYERSIGILNNLPRPAYPIHVPLMETWAAINLNTWDDQLIKVVFPWAYLSYIIIHFWFLKQFTDKHWALGGVALLISANLFITHATSGYRDFFLMYYSCTAIILLILWDRKGWDSLLWLASLYSGFATFTKIEGTFYLAVHTLLLLLILRKRKDLSYRMKFLKFLRFAVISYFIWGFYIFFRIHAGIPMDSGAGIILDWGIFNRIAALLYKICLDLLTSGNWNIIWFFFIISILRTPRLEKHVEASWLLIALSLHFAIITFLAVFTQASSGLLGEAWWTVIPRLVLHAYPLAVLVIILLNSNLTHPEKHQ